MNKSRIVLMLFLCILLSSQAQNNVGINDNNSDPDASAMLDIYSVSKGLLIPRVALTLTTTASPVTSPVASLLIYNTATAGDVTPGYYFWDGISKWVRLVVDADPRKNFNTVAKSESATLLKSENIILASGDITITLPVVTIEDNGLEIAVKNVGTYLDLITVIPEAGKTLDISTSSLLTRWKGRTFIAYGGNWIVKEKETRMDNLLGVSESGSFTTITEVVGFLNSHMTGPTIVEFGAGTYTLAATQTINLPYTVTFQGSSFGESIINGAAGVSGSPLFTCQTECYFKQIKFNAYANTAGNDGIHFTGSGTYNEVKDCKFNGFNKGIVSTNNHTLLWIFEVTFVSCAGAGIEIAEGTASGGSLRVSECIFSLSAIGIHLLSGVSETVSVFNNDFINTNSGTDIAILYVPATFTSFTSMFISSNSWNNQGSFISGFDFSRSDGRDANAFLTNNLGMENENPHCLISVNNNVLFTTVVTALTYYKATWVNTSFYTCKWTIDSNKITYQPIHKSDASVMITGNVQVNKNTTVTIAIIKNGVTATPYGETNIRIGSTNVPFQFSTVIYITDLKQNDYLELYTTTSTNNVKVSFQDIQWFTNTH